MEILTPEEQSIKLQVENQLKNYSGEKATKYVSDKIREQYKYYLENEEVWKDIEEYEGIYKISNFGKVRSLDRIVSFPDGRKRKFKGINLKINISTQYPSIYLCDNTKIKKEWSFDLHRILAQTFIPNPENKPEVNHKDGDKDNFNLDNLEWNTKSENRQHGYDIGLSSAIKGEEHYTAKLNEVQVLEIRKLYSQGGYSYKKLADIYNVDFSNIYAIIKRKSWKHI